jgi:hypothetical protein
MQRWATLNDRQLALLRRIGEGTEPVSSRTPELATTTYALRNRGLVATPRTAGIWTAVVTEAGQFYLEHGHHPDDPSYLPSAASARPAPPERRRQARGAALGTDLIEEVQAAGGTLYVAHPDDATRARYRRALHAAKQHGVVPAGFHLLHTGRDEGDVVIRLESDEHPDETDWNRIRLSVRDLITAPDALATLLQQDRHSIDVSDAVLERALQVVRLLAVEARRRGCQLGASRRGKPRGLHIHAGGHQFPVSLREECDAVPHEYSAAELRERRLYSWRRVQPETDQVPSGRLRIELHGPPAEGVRHWADDKRSPLERKLGSVIEEAGRLAKAADRAREVREREYAAQQEVWRQELAEQERKDAERKAAWNKAKNRARQRAQDDHRREIFSGVLDGWEAAGRIRAFCAVLGEAAASDDAGTEAIARWLAWARAEADRIDPVRNLGLLAGAAFDTEPSADDLRPHLDGWDLSYPVRSREPRPGSRPASTSEDHSSEWQWGHRGRAQWWRR